MSAFRVGLLALALLLPAVGAKAHPHAWIDLESRLIFDAQGRIEAVELDWLFDEFYTAFFAEEFVAAARRPRTSLGGGGENLANLRDYDYFSELGRTAWRWRSARCAASRRHRGRAALAQVRVPLLAPAIRGTGLSRSRSSIRPTISRSSMRKADQRSWTGSRPRIAPSS